MPKMIFKQDCELEVAIRERDHGGEPIFVPTSFKSGDVCEVEILDRDTKLNNIDVQLENGSCSFGIDLALVDIIEDKNLTYLDLAFAIANMTKEQRNQNVTIHDKSVDEYLPVSSISFSEETDVLDKGHAFLSI
jgi:hypothetical protein